MIIVCALVVRNLFSHNEYRYLLLLSLLHQFSLADGHQQEDEVCVKL